MDRFIVQQGEYGLEIWDKQDMSQPMMQANPHEVETNREVIERASGDVLIYGLGIGMIIPAIMNKPDVESVLIVEKHQEVIDKVMPHMNFNEKVTVIQGDANTHVPEQQYKTIWRDTWTSPQESIDLGETGFHPVWLERMQPYILEGGFLAYWKSNATPS